MKALIWRLKDAVAEDHLALVAAGCAFYGLLALFPGIAATVAVAGLVADPQAVADQLATLAGLLPESASRIVTTQATEVAGSTGGALGLAALGGILLALWSASKGVGALIEGLNVVHGREEGRGFLHLAMLRMGMTLGLVLGLLGGLVLMVAVPVALAVLPLGSGLEAALTLLRWPLLAGLTFAGVAALHRWGPSGGQVPVRTGAAVATALWVAGSAGFAIYVANFGGYNQTFGSLGGVVILLFWLWLSAFAVLFGAEIEAERAAPSRQG